MLAVPFFPISFLGPTVFQIAWLSNIVAVVHVAIHYGKLLYMCVWCLCSNP
jgi:hypothetical protein